VPGVAKPKMTNTKSRRMTSIQQKIIHFCVVVKIIVASISVTLAKLFQRKISYTIFVPVYPARSDKISDESSKCYKAGVLNIKLVKEITMRFVL